MSGLKDKMTAQEFRAYLTKVERARDSKFGAIPCESSDGQKFRSHLELAFYNRIRLMPDLEKFEREVRFELVVNGVFVCAYVCDFILYWKNGTIEHIDTKSSATMTQTYRIKKQLMLACHGIQLKEVYK